MIPSIVCRGEFQSSRREKGRRWFAEPFSRGLRRDRKAVHNTRMQNPDLEQLVTVVMPFGKYKGRLLADLPGPYLNWLAREGFPRGEIGRQLALMHEIDHNGLRDLLAPLRNRG